MPKDDLLMMPEIPNSQGLSNASSERNLKKVIPKNVNGAVKTGTTLKLPVHSEDSVQHMTSFQKRSFVTEEYIAQQILDVNHNIQPFWLTNMLGTWKQYPWVLFFLISYIYCCYIVVTEGLFEMEGMEVEDYFDRNDIFTQKMFTDYEIRNQFDNNT